MTGTEGRPRGDRSRDAAAAYRAELGDRRGRGERAKRERERRAPNARLGRVPGVRRVRGLRRAASRRRRRRRAPGLRRARRASGELRALKAQVAALEEALEREGVGPGVETLLRARELLGDRDDGDSKPGEPKRRDSKPGAKKKADARAGGGVSEADGDETNGATKETKPPWRRPDLKPERGPTPATPTKTKRSALQNGAESLNPKAGDDAEKTRRVDDENATSASAAEAEATKTRTRAAALEAALAASERSAAAAAENHASASKRAADDHAKFVAAMNVALSEANAARDAILAAAADFSEKTSRKSEEVQEGEARKTSRQDKTRRLCSARRLVARDAAAAELAEVRDEHAAFASMRNARRAELAAKDAARRRALAARRRRRQPAAAGVCVARRGGGEETAAVEDEFRAALAESAAEHARLAAEVDEFTRVAREALHGKGEVSAWRRSWRRFASSKEPRWRRWRATAGARTAPRRTRCRARGLRRDADACRRGEARGGVESGRDCRGDCVRRRARRRRRRRTPRFKLKSPACASNSSWRRTTAASRTPCSFRRRNSWRALRRRRRARARQPPARSRRRPRLSARRMRARGAPRRTLDASRGRWRGWSGRLMRLAAARRARRGRLRLEADGGRARRDARVRRRGGWSP